MPKAIALVAFCLLLASQAQAQNPRVWLDFERGPVILSLDMQNAPITSQNFLDYVGIGFYDGIIIHRIVEDFVIQGGGYDENFLFRAPVFPAIQSERNNGLGNVPGSIAMALSANNVNSAQAQFYINTVHNDFLDENFTVFGQVVFGMSVIDELEQLRTGTRAVNGANLGNVPMSPPRIRRAVQIQGDGFPIMPQHTGSWLDASNSGVGFNVEIARDTLSDDGARLVVYWYDFRNGAPYWLLGVGEYDYGSTEVTVDLISWDGVSGAVDFQTPPPGEGFVVVGELTMRFHDCNSATFDYQVDELGSASLSVSRLTLPEGGACEGI
jgi:peptidyl-prolyl cis-trans isomerase A (cyclophilin A)